MKEELIEGSDAIRSPLLSSILSDFHTHLTARGRSPRTHEAYDFALRELEAYGKSRLGRSLRISDLTLPFLEGYIAHRPELGANTRAGRVYCMRTLCAFLVGRELIGKNPARELKAPEVILKPAEHLRSADVVKMLAAPGGARPAYDYHRWQIGRALLARDELLLELLYSAALRNSECHGLRLDNIKLGEREVVLTVTGKRNKTREMLITGPLIGKLRAYLAVRNELVRAPCQWLLLSRTGRRLTNKAVANIVGRWCSAAKVQPKTWPHLLRHTRATHLLHSGASPAAVQDLLGHASEKTTRRYAHGGLKFQRDQLGHHPSLTLIHRIRDGALSLVDRMLGKKGLAED